MISCVWFCGKTLKPFSCNTSIRRNRRRQLITKSWFSADLCFFRVWAFAVSGIGRKQEKNICDVFFSFWKNTTAAASADAAFDVIDLPLWQAVESVTLRVIYFATLRNFLKNSAALICSAYLHLPGLLLNPAHSSSHWAFSSPISTKVVLINPKELRSRLPKNAIRA